MGLVNHWFSYMYFLSGMTLINQNYFTTKIDSEMSNTNEEVRAVWGSLKSLTLYMTLSSKFTK